MAYFSDNKCCGTCMYWLGRRKFEAFNGVNFDPNELADCGKPGASNTYGHAGCSGACLDWGFIGKS